MSQVRAYVEMEIGSSVCYAFTDGIELVMMGVYRSWRIEERKFAKSGLKPII